MKEEDLELIDRFLRGELPANEVEAFKRRLDSEPELRALHEDVELMVLAVKSVAAEKMIRKAGAEHTGEARIIPWSKPRVLALAASLFLISLVGIWLYTSQTEALINQYYAAYTEMELRTSRGSIQLHDLKSRALDAYRAHNIAVALAALDSALSLSTDDDEVLILTGLCRLEEGSYQKALEAFDKLDENTSHQAVWLWYRALAHLGLEEYDQCRKLLIELENAFQNPYSAKASELRKKLP